jgi:hypothetical protein
VDAAKKKEKPSAIDDLLDRLDEAAAEPSPIWLCSYSPTYNRDWHDDVVCSNGAEEHAPTFVNGTASSLKTRSWSRHEYERHLNGG